MLDITDIPQVDLGSPGEAADLLAEQLRALMDLENAPAAAAGVSNVLGLDGSGTLVRGAAFAVIAADYGILASNTAAQNSAALAALVTAIMARTYGGSIFFPAGKYSFDPASQVSFPKVSGKFIELTGEVGATIFDIGASTTAAAFYVGDPSTSSGNVGFACRNIKFVGGSTTTGIAFKLEWANSARFENCHFSTMKNAAYMTSSYAVEFICTVFENVGGVNIYSSTSCHHLVIDRCKVYNAGVAGTAKFVHIDAGLTDNVVIRACDFESCRQILAADDGLTSLIFEGNYMEYCVVDAFDFGTGCFGTSMSNNWLALGLAFTFHLWTGGEFSRNRLYNQNISFGSDCTDIHVADNYVSGTSTLTTSSLMHTISSFLNSATANATYPPKYSKSDGIVQLHGQIDNCPGGGAPVFSLPAGYRPLQTGCWPAVKSDNVTFRAVVVDASNGNVVPSSAAAESIRLDGVMYRVAN